MSDADEGPINQSIKYKGGDERVTERRLERHGLGITAALEMFERGAKKHPADGEARRAREMNHKSAMPAGALDRKMAREPPHGNGKDGEDVPVGEVAADGELPAHGIAQLGANEIELAGEGEADQRPDGKRQEPTDPAKR